MSSYQPGRVVCVGSSRIGRYIYFSWNMRNALMQC